MLSLANYESEYLYLISVANFGPLIDNFAAVQR